MRPKRLPRSPRRINRIAARVRILLFGVPALAVAVLLVIGNFTFDAVADDFARRLARQYSIEAAANFQINTNPHFVLMQQVSRSTTIARWLANEDDPEAKADAFDEIMGYVAYAPDMHLMLTVYGSLQGYDFDVGLTMEEFVPWGTLAGGEVSRWFYDTRDAEMPFILNIQRTRLEDGYYDLYVWTNHRVYYQGRFVGVVTVGSPFEGILDSVFGHFDETDKRGYIIDREGAVRIDSSGQLELFDGGLATRPVMPEVADNPALAEAIQHHLQKINGGIFQLGLYTCDTIPLPAGMYRYASIAPIIGTDWSVVVLSGHVDVFGAGYLFPILGAIAALVVAVIAGNILVRRIALVPLYKLTQSAAEMADDRSDRMKLFGLERKDEIGDLARNIQRARDELKRHEREREANALNELLLDSSPFVVNIWDDTMTVTETNAPTVPMFGLDNIEQFYEHFHELSPEYQPCGTSSEELSLAYVKQAFAEGKAKFEWMHRTLDGQPLPTEITLVRVAHQGRHIVAAYVIDLRPIKEAIGKAWEAERESRAKTQFLARMSHEIRTPMNVVLGVTELQLQKGGHTPETEEAFLRIYNSASLLLSIINDILDLSKVEAGKMEIIPDSYETADLILDVIQLNLVYIGSKHIKFELDVDENLPVRLIGDVFRIKQILGNILSNAFKYTKEGVVSLTVGIEKKGGSADDDVAIVFGVRDTGPGMTEEQAAMLFDEYYRFDAQNNAIEGSGLGMPIAYALVKTMQGDLKVESEPGSGTLVIVTLPQKRKGDEVLGSEVVAGLLERGPGRDFVKRQAKQTRVSLPYGRVLVVDDVESNLYVAEGFLRQYDLNVETVQSGKAAIEKVKAGEEYDIIFMDHMMPEMDGMEAVRIIRAMGYTKPIIALTANNLKGQAEVFMENGFSGFVSKPIDLPRLDTYLMRFVRDAHNTNQDLDTGLPVHLRQSFLHDVKKALAVLEALMAKGVLGEDDIKNYIVQVHGMKSAPYYLGYKELSEAAGALQAAAWAGDMETVYADTPGFLEDLRQMIAELSPGDEA